MIPEAKTEINKQELANVILDDYRLACISRECSLLGRREVLTGKAKFGIFNGGKELAQIALAKQVRNGDWRSGYYRDQTFMFAINALSVQEFFSALYGTTDLTLEPASGGRQMGGHFTTRLLDDKGNWKNHLEQFNSSADISCTAGQMPRLLGLALASKLYRKNKDLHYLTQFSDRGNEIAFGTIGDASTSEGHFWETINAACVLEVPMLISVWDNGHGISVSKKYQTTKESISKILAGFEKEKGTNGLKIFTVNGWDYAALCNTYEKATKVVREEHIPVLVHVENLTQFQGHSTSGSHERYKSEERLKWEDEWDCNVKFKEWIIEKKIASVEQLDQIENKAKKFVRDEKSLAWKNFNRPIKQMLNELIDLFEKIELNSRHSTEIRALKEDLKHLMDPVRSDVLSIAREAALKLRDEGDSVKGSLSDFVRKHLELGNELYGSHLYSESSDSPLKVKVVPPEYEGEEKYVDGRMVLRGNFEMIFSTRPEVLTFGEDTGKIGGVNAALEGLQEKYGEERIFDVGIREATIIGQGIGLAMRGLRPIAEIQYLDYLLYGLQTISDDLATLQYRTKGGQKAPLIIRTRGHRFEGIWHAGSPMGMIVNACRGIQLCVPRNMTQAAGMYNTLLRGDDPGIVIEPLNGYRKKELLPSNLGEFTVPLGTPEVVIEGTDLTLVSYGSTFNLAEKASQRLQEIGISVELIDVQTLLPFDIHHSIVKSVEKTNQLVCLDEDVNGGATAYMLDKILVEQGAYQYLDGAPLTISGKDHRTAYTTDGDYFSKPSLEDIIEKVYALMNDYNPTTFPKLR